MILVIDGSGGKVGAEIIKKLRNELGAKPAIIAIGTNAIATSAMIKAGANNGATGENATCHSVKEAEFIIGPANILIPNSYYGELSPVMADAIANCKAKKLVLPIDNENIMFITGKKEPIPHILDKMIEALKGGTDV